MHIHWREDLMIKFDEDLLLLLRTKSMVSKQGSSSTQFIWEVCTEFIEPNLQRQKKIARIGFLNRRRANQNTELLRIQRLGRTENSDNERKC